MDSRRRHVSPPSSHSFGRHMSGGIGDGGTSGSSGHRRSSSPSHAYVNTISSSASDTSTSYVNVDLTGSSLCDPLDGDFQSIYVALCDYRTMAPGCLSFSEGDKAQLMQVKGQGWWKVKMNNDNGWVPASYFEKEVRSDLVTCFMRLRGRRPKSDMFGVSRSLANVVSFFAPQFAGQSDVVSCNVLRSSPYLIL